MDASKIIAKQTLRQVGHNRYQDLERIVEDVRLPSLEGAKAAVELARINEIVDAAEARGEPIPAWITERVNAAVDQITGRSSAAGPPAEPPPPPEVITATPAVKASAVQATKPEPFKMPGVKLGGNSIA